MIDRLFVSGLSVCDWLLSEVELSEDSAPAVELVSDRTELPPSEDELSVAEQAAKHRQRQTARAIAGIFLNFVITVSLFN